MFLILAQEKGYAVNSNVLNKWKRFQRAAAQNWRMPVMNGYEATANIRAGKSDYWKNIPVIAMTANVFQEDESRAAECGMSDYVTKPIDMNVIYSVLEKWLRGQKG